MKIKIFYMFMIFSFFFCSLFSGGPIHFLRNLGRKQRNVKQEEVSPEKSLLDVYRGLEKKFVKFDKIQFETNERDWFYSLINKCCKTEELMLDIKQFCLEENEFVKDLEYKIPIMNKAIRLLRDAQDSYCLSCLTENFNKQLQCFLEEKKIRYCELINDLNNYTQNGDGLLHRLILTKYELLREKQRSMILIWHNFCDFFYLSIGLLLCRRIKQKYKI